MRDKQSPTVAQAVEQVLAQVDGPITMDDFSRRVLTIRPSKAKNPLASLRNHLRWEQAGQTMIYLDAQTLLPLRIAMRGVRFRITLAPQEATRGILFVHPAFEHCLRRDIHPVVVQLEDQEGRPLPVRQIIVQKKMDGPWGEYTQERPAFDLGDWFRTHRIQNADSILVTIQDWTSGCFRLEHEPSGQRREKEIEQKDRELADLLFAMLEAAHDESLDAHVAIPTVYARLSDPRGYPGHHWSEVVDRDPRMAYDGWTIRYSDSQTLRDMFAFEEDAYPEVSFSAAQGRQVYRFKAALWQRRGLWRTIEIQGGQTLAIFDAILRNAFGHDSFDHLGGFWKLVRRGQGKRFREVDLGTLARGGGGEGAGVHIAGLGLEPGHEMKYVYDFGDWIEHRIALEGITEPEKGVKYPRIVARNQPRYQNCESCQAQGRTVRATWICLSCSHKQQREVLVCEECMMKEHEDHSVEKILY